MSYKSIKYSLAKNGVWLLPLLPVLFLALLIWKGGLRLSYDSQQFLCAAQSFSKGGELQTCEGAPMVLSAIGFPVVLSVFSSPEVVYAFLSPFLLWLTISLWLSILKKRSEGIAQITGIVGVLFGLPLFFPFLFLWSEGLFLTMFSFGYWSLNQFKRKEDHLYLALACLFFCLSVSLRLAGVFIVVPVVVLEIYKRADLARKREMSFCLFAVLLVFLGMMIRNWVHAGSLVGARQDSVYTVLEVVEHCASTLSGWILPTAFLGKWSFAPFLLGIAFASKWGNKEYLWLIFFYSFCIAVAAITTEIEHDERLFVPVYPFFILLLVSFWENKTDGFRWKPFATLTAVLWMVFVVVRFCKNYNLWSS